MALSVLARLVRRNAFAEFETGESGPRTSTHMPAQKGFARGTMGATGSVELRSRNPQAGEQRDRTTLDSSMFASFLRNMKRF